MSKGCWLARMHSAVEDGQLDGDWLQSFLAQQVPGKGVNIFALDGSPWPRPRARALEDRQYVYQASSDVNGSTVPSATPIHSWSGPWKRIPAEHSPDFCANWHPPLARQNNAEFRPAGPKASAERPNPVIRWSKRRLSR